jgi:hypothetical protein
VHTGDRLKVTTKERDALVPKATENIFPEYYIIRVNDFDQVAVTPLDEWISYLKTDDIPAEATAPGLPEARERMLFHDMSVKEQRAYTEHLINIMIQNDMMEGYEIEIAEAKRRLQEEEKRANTYILRMKEQGYPIEDLMKITGLSREEIESM